MRVRIPEEAELAPFHRAALASLVALGAPRVHDLNDLDADTGVAPSPANIVDGVRWNAALAYLDPVRERASLRICGDAPVERLLVAAAARTARSCGEAASCTRCGRPRDRVRRRLRLPRAAAALGHRAGRRSAGARHPRRRRPTRRRRQPARPSRARAPVLGHARADPGLQRPRRERRVRAGRGRDREAALVALRACGLRPARLPGRRPRLRRRRVLAPRRLHDAALARHGAAGGRRRLARAAARPRLLQRSRRARSRRAARRRRAGAGARAQRPVRRAARRGARR